MTRKLVRLCIHDQIKPHPIGKAIQRRPVVVFEECSGGEFLPEGALVIEKVEGEWPEWAVRAGMGFGVVDKLLKAKANADALASQVGESER